MTRDQFKDNLENCTKEHLIKMLLEQWDGLVATQCCLEDATNK